MSKHLIAIGIAAVVGIAAIGLMADEYGEDRESHEHEQEHRGEREWDEDPERRKQVRDGRAEEPESAYLSDPGYPLYERECGDCHLAYPPPMLPAPSWNGMMGALGDHFGDNAELDAATSEQIAAFLARNAAGETRSEHGKRTWRATRDRATMLRITETDYFLGQHHEIPAKMVSDNAEVVSFSRCEACHAGADQGAFDEHEVRIPGYGRWDD
ncbi:MAG: diacylglycerol kinase [Pseudomonadota bacterium]|nr:diacylglycerol kinase [Pseudomonadota bacterium]